MISRPTLSCSHWLEFVYTVCCHYVIYMPAMQTFNNATSGADPALVVGGGANSLDRGADPIYFINFLKNPMKLKKFWSVEGGCAPGAPPLRSATEHHFLFLVVRMVQYWYQMIFYGTF